jgi:metal-sulfur cluster biosynthetic enzyme
MNMPDESAVLDALSTVDDPEAGMSIVALGLVYNVAVSGDEINVEMTMTTAACPVADSLVEQSRAAIAAISPSGAKVRVTLVWEPIWNPSMMSGIAKEFFGWPG